MTCPRCGSANPEGSLFCSSCGAPLGRSCPSCGATASPDARFCGACGSALGTPAAPPAPAAPTPAGERRPATILFADVVGFSALAERLDPEDLRSLMTDTFERITSAIRDEDGWVEKFIGDAVMAVFGMPAAHEDDPARAVRAALAIQRTLDGTDLRVRVGVNTGLVVTGPVGDGSAVGVMGDAVNVAARLQQMADPGSVLVSDSTHRLVRHLFVVRSLGSRPLKGKAEQIGAHEVLGEREKPDRLRALAPLVGRDGELTILGALWHTVRKGRPQLVSVVGEPGVGKTRLVDEFAEIVRDEGTVLRGSCPPRQSAPYAPIIEMFEASIGPDLDAAGMAATAERLGVDAEAARLVSGLLGLAPLDLSRDEEEVRRRCFAALAELLAGFGGERPALVVLEDVHWADPSTWDLLAYLVRRLPPVPLGVLLTYRPAFDAVETLRMQAAHTVMRLDPLGTGEAERLARALTEGAMPEAVARAVAERAEGNPFFVEEIVRSLVDRGMIVRDAAGWRLTQPVEEMGIPETVQGVILARMDRLPEPARRTLQRASVIGREFTAERLGSLSAGASIAEDLDTLERADLLVATGGIDARLEFKHALTQEVAYGTLLLRQRQTLHRQLAETLEREGGSDAASLAYHWLQAGDADRARVHAIAAADAASSVFAIRDADRHLSVALECVGTARTRERADLLFRRGSLRTRAAIRTASADAMGMLEEAASIYEELGDRAGIARTLSRLGTGAYFGLGDYEAALRYFERAREIFVEEREDEALVGMLADRALVDLVQGRPETGIAASERGLAIAERLGLAQYRARFLDTLAVFRGQQGRVEEALELMSQALAVARETDNRDEIGRCYVNLNWLYYNVAGDVRRAIEIGVEGVRVAGDLGLELRRLIVSLNLGQALGGAGRFAEAMEIAKNEAAATPDPPNWAFGFMNLLMGWTALQLGDIAGAREYATIAVAAGSRTQESQHMVPSRLTLAWCAAESGDRATALEELDEIATFFEASASDRSILSEDLFNSCVLAFSLGDRERGVRFGALLEQGRGDRPDAWSRACLATVRAEAAAAEGRVEEARAAFERADAVWPETGRPWLHARTLRRWAETVAPPEERRGLLERASAIAGETTARLEQRRIAAALADA